MQLELNGLKLLPGSQYAEKW